MLGYYLATTNVKNCLMVVFKWLCVCMCNIYVYKEKTKTKILIINTYSEPGEKQLVQLIQFQTFPFCKKKSNISSYIKLKNNTVFFKRSHLVSSNNILLVSAATLQCTRTVCLLTYLSKRYLAKYAS